MSSNVTVNGLPLEEHLDQEHRAEIRSHRVSEERVKLNRHVITKANGNLHRTKTRKGRVIYRDGQKETHVIIAGIVFDWAAKAPYVPSGYSQLGVLEYSRPDDLIKCHQCGGWVRQLAYHVRSHGMTADQYRREHGFRMATRLRSPTVAKARLSPNARAALTKKIKSSTSLALAAKRQMESEGKRWAYGLSPELANLQSKCKAQLTARLKRLYSDLGRTPTTAELGANQLWPSVLINRFGMPVRDILKSFGMTPRRVGYSAAHA